MTMIKYQNGFKYQLYETYVCDLGMRFSEEIDHPFFYITRPGRLTVKKGYAWDGPSGPTVDTKDFMRGSLIHDVLYQAIRLELLPQSFRETADQILKDICLKDGMSKVRAWWVYRGVRIGAGSAALPKNERKILEAP